MGDHLPPIIATPAVVVMLLCWRELVAHSVRAGTNQFAAIARYKQWLRSLCWGGMLTMAGGFVLFELIARLDLQAILAAAFSFVFGFGCVP